MEDNLSTSSSSTSTSNSSIDNQKQQSKQSSSSTTTTSSSLDIDLVCNCFQNSIQDKNAINLALYLQGYNELIKFFDIFGTLFSFVTKDVQTKINLLKKYLEDTEYGSNYATIQSMIEWEISSNLIKDKKHESGSRTLLRLHRALEFISLFLHEITKLDDDCSTTTAARQAYSKTLAKYHPWYIRQSVSIATIALPYRKCLIEKIYGERFLKLKLNNNVLDNNTDVDMTNSKNNDADNVNDGDNGTNATNGPNTNDNTNCISNSIGKEQFIVNDNLNFLANIADQVFEATQKLYEDNNLLDLP